MDDTIQGSFGSLHSQGSVGNSWAAGVEEVSSVPSIVDVKRLQRLKAEQEQRLKSLCVRVDRLSAQEQRVWKDVAWTQQRSLQAQEKQWQRQEQQAERLRLERELLQQEQALRDRTREMRLRAIERKDAPRLQKFEENKSISRQVREETKRHTLQVNAAREQALRSKAMHVEVRRQQRRQQQLQRDLEMSRRVQARQDVNLMRFNELQEEIQNAELAIAVAEREEMSAVQRLQNSQTVRAEVLSQLQDIETRKPMSPRSQKLANDDFVSPLAASSTPGPGQMRGSGVRPTRSSPRLGGRLGGGSPPPAASTRSRLGMHSSHSGLSVGRMDLSQISEEEAPPQMKTTTKLSPGARSRLLRPRGPAQVLGPAGGGATQDAGPSPDLLVQDGSGSGPFNAAASHQWVVH